MNLFSKYNLYRLSIVLFKFNKKLEIVLVIDKIIVKIVPATAVTQLL